MMLRLSTTVIAAYLLVLAPPSDSSGRQPSTNFELINQMNNVKENWALSPVSFRSVMALLIEGASGETLRELCKNLKISQQKVRAQKLLRSEQSELPENSRGTVVKSANRILVRDDIRVKDEYKQNVKVNYQTDVRMVDFSNKTGVLDEVNAWVKSATDGNIPAILDSESIVEMSSMLFINTLYFKSIWKLAFDPKATGPLCFYPKGSDCVPTETMQTKGVFRSGHLPRLDSDIIEIPYTNERYSMIIVMPRVRSLNEVIAVFRPDMLQVESLSYNRASLRMPKFTINYRTELTPILKQMGMTKAFTPSLDFKDIFGPGVNSDLIDIIQSVKIDVNEQGTVAAAATVAAVQTLTVDPDEFWVNRPFMYIIQDKQLGYLFTGAYHAPQPNQKPTTVKLPTENRESSYITSPDQGV